MSSSTRKRRAPYSEGEILHLRELQTARIEGRQETIEPWEELKVISDSGSSYGGIVVEVVDRDGPPLRLALSCDEVTASMEYQIKQASIAKATRDSLS